ncbi:hypothetical protein PoB_004890100 [Plakobranchus ocellatus]|uniref:Uncharacterized protein n=1 Tax=Plakobranchus ocellatus TaxID=259542 RepID=A0AAV4BTK3_9GAST|nr:hypothetical protein PoB_004890100 [Plakobranchus ocellatus]
MSMGRIDSKVFVRIDQVRFLYIASPQKGDLRLSGPPSGQGAGGGTRIRDRMVRADLRASSLDTVPPTPHTLNKIKKHKNITGTITTIPVRGRAKKISAVTI